jgi:hypothetical protein
MLPGPPIHRRCGHCERIFSQPTYSTANTFGAVQWSDAKIEAPMAPTTPRLVKCPHCSWLLWLTEAPLAYPPEANPSRVRYLLPTEDDLFRALGPSVAATEDKLRYVRTDLWWRANDTHRKTPPRKKAVFPDQHRQNMIALFGMLSRDVGRECIMKAEIARELGWFAEATDLLTTPFDDSLEPAAGRLRSLLAGRLQGVARL